MITKAKKSISLSNVLLQELTLYNSEKNISQFIETALIYYINELKKQKRRQRDKAIINTNAKRFNKQAEENLQFQAVL
jgi:metal-responsive CopG/Arc/MetJ family transcriptional regulator